MVATALILRSLPSIPRRFPVDEVVPPHIAKFERLQPVSAKAYVKPAIKSLSPPALLSLNPPPRSKERVGPVYRIPSGRLSMVTFRFAWCAGISSPAWSNTGPAGGAFYRRINVKSSALEARYAGQVRTDMSEHDGEDLPRLTFDVLSIGARDYQRLNSPSSGGCRTRFGPDLPRQQR